MLDQHLIAHTNPLANKDNIVHIDEYRITILKEQLFRIEIDESQSFLDEATQAIWFRKFNPLKFTSFHNEEEITIETSKVVLSINRKKFNESYIYFKLENKKVPLNNDTNLKGTIRTLDSWDHFLCIDHSVTVFNKENIPFEMGVMAKNGVAIYDDSSSLILAQNGKVVPRPVKEKDLYVFAYLNEYKEALKALYDICGYPPIVPRFALGNWWSRYYAYTDQEYLNLLDTFEEKKIPLSIATIDMDWHYVDLEKEFKITELNRNTPFYGGNYGWSGVSWNRHLFPDYKSFLQAVKKRNLKVTLNLHPHSGVRWFEDCYPEFAQAMGIDPNTHQAIAFDITNDQFINQMFRIIYTPYEKAGVDFWWIDWQQGDKSALEGLDPLWSLNHYFTLDSQKNHPGEGLILSRYAKVGSHRYPLGFSGDTIMEWEVLNLIPYFTSISTNIGYTWWSHDIGAHHSGYKDDELYVRWIELGVFLPINRLHSTSSPVITKEPWYNKKEIELIVTDMLRLRHQFIPYLYTYSVRTSKYGDALIRPMYYENPMDERAYQFDNQYYYGELIVAPITTKSNNGYSVKEVYLPKGEYVDLFTGIQYQGDQIVRVSRTLAEIPVFMNKKDILPLAKDEGNGANNPEKLELIVYSSDASFQMIEEFYQDFVHTTFTCQEKGNKVQFKITADKTVDFKRDYIIRLRHLSKGNISVYQNQQTLEYQKKMHDGLVIYLHDVALGGEIIVEITDIQSVSDYDYLTEKIMIILNEYNDFNAGKQSLFYQLIAFNSTQELAEQVMKLDIPEELKVRLLELCYLNKMH